MLILKKNQVLPTPNIKAGIKRVIKRITIKTPKIIETNQKLFIKSYIFILTRRA
jgi:hypothetical protein